jgi:hypothetical protein
MPTSPFAPRWGSLIGGYSRLVVLVLVLLVAAVAAPSSYARTKHASTSGVAESSQWFAPTSVWRQPLAATAQISTNSAMWVKSLVADARANPPWMNTTQYSTPIYTVPANEPTVKVQLTVPYGPLQADWLKVPLPRNAVPAAGTDAQLVVWQPSTDSMWEFWAMAKSSSGQWSARWGGMMSNVSQNPGYYTGSDSTWGATATSLPLLGGLITIDDLQRGSIDHALAMAVPNTAAGEYAFPAQRTDGHDTTKNAIPEGTRFRLPASLNLQSLNLPPVTLLLAEAAQRYGIIVRDTSPIVTFYAQDPGSTGTNPYLGKNGLWGSNWPNTIMDAFPWSKLQVVSSSLTKVSS